MSPLVLLAALVLIGWMLVDAFETILLPRRVPARYRVSRFALRWLWGAWAEVGRRIVHRARRENFLSFYALLAVPGLLVLWAGGLVVAFAMLHWADGSHLSGMPRSTSISAARRSSRSGSAICIRRPRSRASSP